MKLSYLSIIAGLLFTASLTACTDEEEATPQEEFFVWAKKDGADWQKTGAGAYLKGRNEFSVYSPDTIPLATSEVVSLRFTLPYGQSLASARPISAEWMEIIGQDGIINSYQTTDSTGLPSITVTHLDTVQKIVEGRFEATLRRNKHYTKQVQLMRFTEGTFRIRYRVYP